MKFILTDSFCKLKNKNKLISKKFLNKIMPKTTEIGHDYHKQEQLWTSRTSVNLITYAETYYKDYLNSKNVNLIYLDWPNVFKCTDSISTLWLRSP